MTAGHPARAGAGRPPDFGAVGSGVSEIFLSADGQGARGFWLSVWVTDVDAVYELCRSEGIEVTRPPQNEPWGVREMHIRHPDGHVFRVSRGIGHDHGHPHDHDQPHDHAHGHPHDHDQPHDHDHGHPHGHDHRVWVRTGINAGT